MLDFEQAAVDEIKKEKECSILSKLVSVRNSPRQAPLSKTGVLKLQNLSTFLLQSNSHRVTIDGADIWAKGWFLPDENVRGTTRRQAGGDNVIIWL